MVRVVLFTASLGDGHNQVASALQHEFLSRGVEVMQVDYFRNNHFKTARFLEHSYEVVTRYVPSIYGGAYKLTSHFGSQHPLWRWTSVVSKKTVLTTLHEYEPDIVLQLFPDHSLANLPRQDRKFIIGVVLTDYSVHGHWFHDNVDIYFLPHEDLLSAANPFLSTSSEVQISGIPIRSQFYTEAPLNLVPNKQEPYILIATGGRGVFPNLREVILTTHEQFATHAVYVMCGRNKLMQDKVRELSLFVPNLHALPFIENVADWIRGASFSIIKSGGITISECLACGCPMILFRPQPGQEEGNARFVERASAARIARSVKELSQALQVMQVPIHRNRMSRSCTTLARPKSAIHIVDHVLNQAALRYV